MRNIYLIGMMGAGKTATGKALADLAAMDFLDLDGEIESETHQSINEIFLKKGESFFRAEEKRILRRAAGQTNTVVATGGGVILDPENVETMRATGQVIYLAAPLEILWKRVRGKQDRPLLRASDPQTLFFELFRKRGPLYEAASHGEIDTEDLAPEAAARWIIERYLK